MAVRAYRVTVGTTATVVSAATNTPRTVILAGHNIQQVEFGGAGLADGEGVHGDHIENMVIRLDPDAVLYGITSSGTVEVEVLEQRQ